MHSMRNTKGDDNMHEAGSRASVNSVKVNSASPIA